ncbi:ribonuclease H-like domain-containing protein [Tanacetum coccineum]
MITRSQSSIVKPIDRLSLHTSSISLIPKNLSHALKDPNWRNDMYDEYNALVKKWHIVPCSLNGHIRLTVLSSLAVSRQWPIHQLDVKEAFITGGTLSEIVYMHQPPGFVDNRYPHHVCLLQRSLYGLKQAPRAWFQRFAGYATRAGFYHSRCDSLLFIYRQGSQIIGSLNNEFDMTDLGALNYFLGISADRTPICLFLSQKKYALQLFERAHMVTCNPSRTPVDTKSKLGPEGAPVQDPTLYRNLAGGLQYLTFTRPDLSYAVQQICLYMHDPREPHLAALKRILRYVQGFVEPVISPMATYECMEQRCSVGSLLIHDTSVEIAVASTIRPYGSVEPFEEPLILSVQDRVGPNKDGVLRIRRCMLPLQYVDRRLDHKTINTRRFNIEKHAMVVEGEKKKEVKYASKIHMKYINHINRT